MNIAIFGGSFDPPHIGHETIINKSLEVLNIDKLIVVPTFLNPFKTKSHLSAKDRFDLLKDLCDNDKIKVSDFEIKQNLPVATIDTIHHIKEIINTDNIYLIIGADNLDKLHLWKNFEQLQHLVTFVIISRNGAKLKNDIIQFINIKMDIQISSSELREHFDLKYIPTKIQKKVKELWKTE